MRPLSTLGSLIYGRSSWAVSKPDVCETVRSQSFVNDEPPRFSRDSGVPGAVHLGGRWRTNMQQGKSGNHGYNAQDIRHVVRLAEDNYAEDRRKYCLHSQHEKI